MEGQAETKGTSGALEGLAKTRRDKQSQAGLCRDKKGHGGRSSGKCPGNVMTHKKKYNNCFFCILLLFAEKNVDPICANINTSGQTNQLQNFNIE